MMRIAIFSLCLNILSFYAVQISVDTPAREKMRLCMLIPDDHQIHDIAQIIQRDLMWSNQFIVDQKVDERVSTKRALKKLNQENYPLVIILSRSGKNMEWRLYDTRRSRMLEGKRVVVSNAASWLAHHCADGIWHALTSSRGCFSSKLAFCKEKRFGQGRRPHKYIYVSDFDGSNSRPLVTTPTVNIAPRWNRASAHEPLIYYSECTLRNVRLVVVDMDGRRRTMSDFDGLNMLVCWSPDSTHAVVCLSRSGATQLYLYKKNEEPGERIEQLTFKGMNISPCFIDNERIVFCSDHNKQKKPHVCMMNLITREITDLVDGYCSSPHYSPVRNQIAYAKLINGELQLCTYHLSTYNTIQLTTDQGSKDECCWSPCGNYLVYAVQEGNKSRIAVLNVNTRFQRFITPETDRCSYPAWSPLYENVALIN